MATETARITPAEPALNSAAPIAAAGIASALLIGVATAVEPALGLAAVLGVLFVPAVMLSVPLGVCIWIPIIFMERVPAFSFGPTLVALMTAGAWLLALPATRQAVGSIVRRHRVLFMVLAALLAWTAASVLWSTDRPAALSDFGWWYAAAATFLIVATSLPSRTFVVAACAAFVIGASASVLAGFIPGDVAVRGDLAPDEAARLAGSLGDPNFLAAGLVPAIALGFGLLAVSSRVSTRWALVVALAILLGGLLATGSRGGIFAALVMVLAALVLERGRRLKIAGLLSLLAVLGVFGIASSSDSSLERLRTFETGNGRVDLWSLAIRMTSDNLVAGVGVNNYRAEAVRYVREPGFVEQPELIIGSPRVAHNTYLQQLAETGVVGAALLLAFLASVLAATYEASRRYARRGNERMAGLSRAVLIAQVGVLTTSVFMSNGYDERIWVVLALGLALLAQASRQPHDT